MTLISAHLSYRMIYRDFFFKLGNTQGDAQATNPEVDTEYLPQLLYTLFCFVLTEFLIELEDIYIHNT